jgi:hypothetical protein
VGLLHTGSEQATDCESDYYFFHKCLYAFSVTSAGFAANINTDV